MLKSRANACLAEGRLDQAEAHYRRTLALVPDYVDALIGLAFVLGQQDRLQDAEAFLRRAIALAPNNVDANYMLGTIVAQRGDIASAISHFDNALKANSSFVPAYRELCRLLWQASQKQRVRDIAQRGTALDAEWPDFHYYLGNLHSEEKNFSEAIACYRRVLSLLPDHVEAMNNMGLALLEQRKIDDAIMSFKQVVAVRPDCVAAYYNLGNAYRRRNDLAAAIDYFHIALSHAPDDADILTNLGATLQMQGDLEQALQYHRKALEAVPDYAQARWNASLAQLLMGNFAEGLENYEWRWKNPELKLHQQIYDRPLWLGQEPIVGKTILLHPEQGFGDVIQFCRYARLLAQQGTHVLLVAPPPLLPLIEGLEDVDRILKSGDPMPAFDYHCPLLSLPFAFKTTINTIPAYSRYLHANASRVDTWQTKLGPQTRMRIGLVWSGQPAHVNDRNRSIPLKHFARLLSDRAEFYSLQKDVRTEDRTFLQELPSLIHYGDDLQDFADTAALIECLDLVICVDTSVAHLAGALGKPVWILLPFIPDWRWLLERRDSPWYPSATLYRQPAIGDWHSVIDAIYENLHRLLERESSASDMLRVG